MIRFNRLQTRLTVLYMGLFGVALVLVAIAVVTAVTRSAQTVVRGELRASGQVYNQIWAARSGQLRQGAAVLAQDYGFREAVATNDEATVRSALDNLRVRQKVNGAMIVGVDGYVTAAGLNPDEASIDTLFRGLQSGDRDAGVLGIGGQPYQVVAAPIMAPVLIGWVVFVERLDQTQMQTLESLSAIPLSATVMTRSQAGWRDMGGSTTPLGDTIESQAKADDPRPVTAAMPEGPAMLLARPLPSFDEASAAVLVLDYPLNRAMKPYESLFLALALIGLAGLGMLMLGTWMLARGLTRPISALDDAVHRLQQGEHAEVEVRSTDEIGRLASSFNAMAGDIRDREARLTHMAMHDQETGLPNRRSLERGAGNTPGGYVALIGVDRFEIVRNAIGYDSMAQLLAALGARLADLTPGAAIARVGAGALGLVFEAGEDAEALEIIAEICEAAEQPVRLNGATVDVSLSAGLARAGQSLSSVDSAVDRAAIALDQTRAARRRCGMFDAPAYGDPGGNLSLISELMTAVQNGEVWLAYQPKYDLRADRINGCEALMRWRHPRRGFVSPDLFIGMAEETGHIRPLTEWVIRQAIQDQRLLAAAGHALTVSVNISGRLLSDEDFAAFALNEVVTSGADLCFEITETAVIDNPEIALGVIDRFAEAGICVSIDDYGSGLSSLAYLKRIRADELKIDKAFVLSLDESSRDALLVKSTIDLAHSLGLKVVAEGVETPTALALLRGMGCDIAQGYLIGKPVALADLVERLAEPAEPEQIVAA
ncbi:putative bifunctional diguanylate cyclase/phosphodiesterase [Brevundimonas sp.]|uniref:putative bifunctional diguanylate cyclase/phosphodiesterase n=1 Tax=Brevundimonas sp. TaxID=1871086 RepID=UPI003BAD9FB5